MLAVSPSSGKTMGPRSPTAAQEAMEATFTFSPLCACKTCMSSDEPTSMGTMASLARETSRAATTGRTSGTRCRWGPRSTKSRPKPKRKTCWLPARTLSRSRWLTFKKRVTNSGLPKEGLEAVETLSKSSSQRHRREKEARKSNTSSSLNSSRTWVLSATRTPESPHCFQP